MIDHFFAEGAKQLASSFKVKSLKKVEDGAMMTLKSTCKLGDQFLADTTSPLLQVEKLEEGETKEADANFYGLTGIDGDPEMCEIVVFFGKIMSSDDPKILAEVCSKGGEVTDGKCEGFTRPTGGKGLEITAASAKLDEITYGDNKGRKDIQFQFTVLMGSAVDDDKSIFVKTACQVGDEKIVNESATLTMFNYAQPGESMKASGSSYPLKGVASDPSQCDLTFTFKGLFDDEGESFGEYCFKDGALAAGKCA